MTDARTHILDTGRRLVAQRGYTAVGLGQLLAEAQVPKGSFYHYFTSKEGYGCALLDRYVRTYECDLAATLDNDALAGRDKVLAYFADWQARQGGSDAESKCLIVKLAAEISDLSPDMRTILQDGVTAIIGKLSRALDVAGRDGSMRALDDPDAMATSLYQLWLGASLMAHLSHDGAPLGDAMTRTRALLPQS
ncbi:TetR/AcrR family transcriptional regulator [Paracoccus sp. SM22M-07]|uniref:TetR/AcrR family transcriptional regulator n=1 Tax=Paracoccus sp. SM22M-07 TaxID=1520813 RepID=UPI00090F6954|nr:TetR/AcrR family transcriptional regulator [Paracoccus sp. SM22M-07]OJH44543.1 TetR family transcriptional regulator [Paracoccus sp. SM22M-07]